MTSTAAAAGGNTTATSPAASVPWPTLEDFTCGPRDFGLPAAPVKGRGRQGRQQQQRSSPSNPQGGGGSGTGSGNNNNKMWGPTHSCDDSSTDEGDSDAGVGGGGGGGFGMLLSPQGSSSVPPGSADRGGGGGNNNNNAAAVDGGGSGSSSSGNRTNPNQGDSDDAQANGNNNYNKRPAIEKMWERAGSFRRKLFANSSAEMRSIVDLGDVCFAAAAGAFSSSSPCIGGGSGMSTMSAEVAGKGGGDAAPESSTTTSSSSLSGEKYATEAEAAAAAVQQAQQQSGSANSSESTRNRRNVGNNNHQQNEPPSNGNSSGGSNNKISSLPLRLLGINRMRPTQPSSDSNDETKQKVSTIAGDAAAAAGGGVGGGRKAVVAPVPSPPGGTGAGAANAPQPQTNNSQLKPIREHEEIEVLPNHKVQVRLPPVDHPTEGKKRRKAPVDTLQINSDMAELERSISELTMRSSYAAGSESLNKIPDNRRMAYYAVGKHHRQSGRGGNRRCYFTGKLILGGAPFYAGSVQQGLRTLVVFCLPSALGLPHKDTLLKTGSSSGGGTRAGSIMSSVMGSVVGTSPSGGGGGNQLNPNQQQQQSALAMQLAALGRPATRQRSRASSSMNSSLYDGHSRLGGTGYVPRGPSSAASIGTRRYMYGGGGGGCGASVASKSMSRYSSLDDLSLSIDGDLDPNWGLDRDYLLSVLPEADAALITKMSQMYPEQFETLPIQVRDPNKWKLFVKFCFFSGLPIAEGEMHYKVRDEIADQVYGEEIPLSHEVMEAVNGESAEILTLPNQKAFRYLRKHYTQQCSKLDERVFRRNCWERVAPEV